MADLSNISWKKFPADAAPDDLVSKNFQLYELTKSDLASRQEIPNNFSSADELRCAVYLCRNVMQPVREKFGRYSPSSVYRSQALERALIHPTKAWQDEIENALASMDGFVALMTDSFHDSDWTDQEVGYAVARGVPIIAVRLGKDPYGFIGKFQALSSTWQAAVEDIVKILIKNNQILSAYIQALRNCPSWDSGNTLAKVLPGIEKLTASQIDALVAAYNETSELRGSFGFNGTKPSVYGPGLLSYLNRLGNRKFRVSSSRLIELVT